MNVLPSIIPFFVSTFVFTLTLAFLGTLVGLGIGLVWGKGIPFLLISGLRRRNQFLQQHLGSHAPSENSDT
ncbi:MAG: hypothetical protein AAF191_17645 [Verrucomicrobiota bacterium]